MLASLTDDIADLLLAPPGDHSQPIPYETRSGTTDANGFVGIPFLYTSGPNFLDVQVAVGALSTNWTAVAC